MKQISLKPPPPGSNMTINVCFIANYSKTIFFEAIALELKKQNINIFWITVSKKINTSLCDTWGKDSVLYINNAQQSQPPISDLRLNEIIQSDRALRSQKESAKKYLENIQQPIFDFIKTNDINFIFGEITWGHEILTLRITKKHPELNCTFLNPHTVRLPKSHFGFFLDEQQSILAVRDCNGSKTAPDLTPEKPSYLKLNDALIKKHFSFRSRLSRAVNFALRKNYDKHDPTVVHNRIQNILIKTKIEINRESYRLVKKYKFNDIKNKKYILYLLHKQPESSVDVIGRYYDDQFTNILNIWRSLPQDHSLLVKEHSNAIGDRGCSFYKKLSNLSDTYIIDEKEETYNLISHAKGIATVSGTAAYESALMGINSFTFAPTFFNQLDNCTHINLNLIKDSDIFARSERAQHGNILYFSNWLNQRIFKGVISDPISDLSCISKENLASVTNAFIEITKHTDLKNAQ